MIPRASLLALLVGLLSVLASGLAQPALAAIVNVNTTEDEDNVDGDCSLREAIRAADQDVVVDACGSGGGADVVNVPAGVYVLVLGDLSVSSTEGLSIVGAGADVTILDGNASDRILSLSGAVVSVSGVTIRNGVATSGGGINVSNGNLTLSNSVVIGNTANSDGGGINNSSGTVSLLDTTVSGNDAGRDGGGVNSSSATTTLEQVTLSGNTAVVDGGGIQISDGTVTVLNSTISGNTAADQGGGLFKTGGTVTLTNVTVNSNGATEAGGGIFQTGGTITLANTIVANSTSGGDCAGGAPISSGGNLDTDGSCALVAAGDLPNTDPILGLLANNGGPTLTHALLSGSPAIDAGAEGACPAVDQRGVTRPQDGDGDTLAACDIGAFELEGGGEEGEPLEVPTLGIWALALFSLLLAAGAAVSLGR
ncbi:MAG TPA: CSLREA domain-containing protein [Thermoanaerobaculia bacterium]|nr:CSLREA domain-containing protein [Thermoanaerobaculia bacterium]